jgi:hypothetical protein
VLHPSAGTDLGLVSVQEHVTLLGGGFAAGPGAKRSISPSATAST